MNDETNPDTNDDNSDTNTPNEPEGKSDQALSPFERIIDELKFVVKTTLGLPEDAFKLEVASFDNLDPVIRIHHPEVLAGGIDWVAIVSIIDTWTTKDGRTRRELSDRVTINRRYVKQVADKEQFGLFRDGINPLVSHRFSVAGVSPKVAIEDLIGHLGKRVTDDLVRQVDKEFADDLSPTDLDELDKANAEADRGETVPAEEVLAELKARHEADDKLIQEWTVRLDARAKGNKLTAEDLRAFLQDRADLLKVK